MSKRAHTVWRQGGIHRSTQDYINTLGEQLSQPNLPEQQRIAIEANIDYAERTRRIPPRGRGKGDGRVIWAEQIFRWRGKARS